MKNEKVLHIITVSFVINHFFGKQFLYLKEKLGTEFHLGCSGSDDFHKNANNLGYKPLELDITREISPIKDFIAIVKAYWYIKKNKIDKVIGHTPKGGMVAMIAAYLAGVTDRIYFRHGLVYETSTGVNKYILVIIEKLSGFLATKVVCVSSAIKKISEDDNLNNPRKNIILGLGTCNGIDTIKRFNPLHKDPKLITFLKNKYFLNNDSKVVGFVGRLVKDKGIDDLLDAWEIVKLEYPNARLLLVGPIEKRDSISEKSKNQIKNDESIIFTDVVLDSSPFYSLMDLFVLPTYREGFPTVSLEASSMNLPVIITKATGCLEAIIENKTGLFVSNKSTEIAKAIIWYLNNNEIAQLHGIQGRAFVQNFFEQTKIWDEIAVKL